MNPLPTTPRSLAGQASGQLRIGLFTHSTNPRGGVVHVLELAGALRSLGHHPVVHAPDESGVGMFRDVAVELALVPAGKVAGDLGDLVRQRVDEYLRYLRRRGAAFDIYHAHDGITGCVLAELTQAGVIPGFVRTVHHLDHFSDPFLREAQDRSVTAAAACLCVSRHWADFVSRHYHVTATIVPNGVDTARFSPATHHDGATTAHADQHEPVFLSVGGIERRKNSVNVLRAFLMVRQRLGRGSLRLAGGVSLLDHSAYRREFEAALGSADPASARAVRVLGRLTDAEMVAEYHAANALLFPSIVEGFGLAVLEAMACGTPVVTSAIAPFTEYLTADDALLVDPNDPAAIADAALRALEPTTRSRLIAAGVALSARYSWASSALAHVAAYERVLSTLRG